MAAYILRRLLLIIPTLIGIMLVNFTLTQFVPGGPIEQVIARVQGEGDAFRNIAGAGDTQPQNSEYAGARGIPPELLDQLEVQMGFAKIVCEPGFTAEPSLRSDQCSKEKIGAVERFGIMLGNYLRFDFGTSFFRSISVVDLVLEKMPVSITLGLWSTIIAYLISIPLGIRKAVRNGTPFDTWTSGAIIVGYAIPAFLFAVLLMVVFAGGSYWQIFPLRGLTSDNFADLSLWGKVKDYLWHITLPVVATTISSFATLTLLTKNSFLDEIGKQYVMTARAKGLTEGRVLYGHVFRNAMLIVIAGFPAMFLGVFFGASILIETIFSLDGLGRLGFEAAVQRDYPVIFGTLYVFGLLGLLVGILSDIMYVLVDPRIDFEKKGRLMAMSELNRRRLRNFRRNKRAFWSLLIFSVIFVASLFAELIANDRPIVVNYKGGWYFPAYKFYPETQFGGDFGTEAIYTDPGVQCLIKTGGRPECWDDPEAVSAEAAQTGMIAGQAVDKGWMIWPPIPYHFRTINNVGSAPSAPDGAHLLGTDDTSRDVLARVIYGFRLSILFTLIVTIVSSVIGVAAGAVQGYFGGRTDLALQRLLEIWSSTPSLYVIIILFAILGRGFWLLVGISILFGWPALVGVVRAEFLRARNFEYVRAARALGVSDRTIMFRHILPNAMVATLTMLPFVVTGTISSLAALDYLGYGLPTSAPSLGELALQAKQNLQAPWLAFTAFFSFAIMLSLLVFIFEGIRDAFDPRKIFR